MTPASGRRGRGTIDFHRYDATITANGKTINERDTWTSFFYPDGSREAGLTVHIQGPGGIVQLDSGQIVRDADGNVIYTHGRIRSSTGRRSVQRLLRSHTSWRPGDLAIASGGGWLHKPL